MKNDIAFRLAKASVLKEKRNYIISFSMMIIAFMFTFIFSGYLTLSKESNALQRKMNYGGWSVCYENQNQKTKDFFKNSEAIDAVAILQVSNILDNGNYIANYSSDYFTMNYITLLEGQLPSNKNEVVVLQGLNKCIGDTIEIKSVYPSVSTQTYKVVGIMNDYNQLWITPSVDYFVYNHDVYKDYTYLASSALISDLIGIDDCLYNYSLLDRNMRIETRKLQGHGTYVDFTLGKNDDNTIMNTFIIVVSVGLFISVFYNINQREKNVFLLRCIGMSKRNMRKYIFYEIIIVGIIALFISLVVGVIALLGLSIFVYKQMGVFLFVNAFIKSISYICVLLFVIVCFVYLSILPISIHSMDSLIHKNERKILKKYSKAKRMNIINLSDKMAGRYRHYAAALTFLIIVEVICLNAIYSYSHYYDGIGIKDSVAEYAYFLDYKDEAFIEKMFPIIKEHQTITYTKKELDTGDYYGDYYFYNLEGLEDHLTEGRLPQNSKECLAFTSDGHALENRYKTGDIIDVVVRKEDIVDKEGLYIDTRRITEPMRVVGTINLKDYYDLYQYQSYRVPASSKMFAVYADDFNKDDWNNFTYLKVSKDIFFQLNELSNIHNPYNSSYNNRYNVDSNNLIFVVNITNNNSRTFATNQMLIYVPVIFISLLFVVFVIRLLVDKLNKDFKLVRCLGMTFKQTISSYIRIGMSFAMYPMIYYLGITYIRFNYYSQLGLMDTVDIFELLLPMIIITVLCAVHVVGFIVYAYKKTTSTVTFYPTDVERYY